MSQYTLVNGVLERLLSWQDKAKERLDKIRARIAERPDWMKITDKLNSERENRVEELYAVRPDLYALRLSYIERDLK